MADVADVRDVRDVRDVLGALRAAQKWRPSSRAASRGWASTVAVRLDTSPTSRDTVFTVRMLALG
jgi:hypothetical protein